MSKIDKYSDSEAPARQTSWPVVVMCTMNKTRMNIQGKLARVIWAERMGSQQLEGSQEGGVSGGGKARTKAPR